MKKSVIILNVMAILLLILFIVCAYLYWSTGIFYSVTGIGLILFIITVSAVQRFKK